MGLLYFPSSTAPRARRTFYERKTDQEIPPELQYLQSSRSGLSQDFGDVFMLVQHINQGKLISLYQVVPSGQKSEAANLELNKPNMGAEFLEFANKPNMGANKPNMGAHSLKI